MLLSPRKNGLTSLFKEVRVFKALQVHTTCPCGPFSLGAGKEQSTKLLVAQNGWRPRFGAKAPPEKVCVGPFFSSFPRENEAHKLLFWGPKSGGFGWGAKSLC